MDLDIITIMENHLEGQDGVLVQSGLAIGQDNIAI